MKTVFFVRALFQESMLPKFGIDQLDMRKLCETFDKYSSVKSSDFRKLIHDIQLESLKNVSDHVITNYFDGSNKTGWYYPWTNLQSGAIDELMTLDDDDIVIPVDDDDWFSPELKKLSFEPDMMNIWHTVEFYYKNGRFRHVLKTPELPDVLEGEDIQKGRWLLSNCYSLPARLIKNMIKDKDSKRLNILMLRHTLVRGMARELKIKEKIHNQYLSIYVKHPCNSTLLERLPENCGLNDFNSGVGCVGKFPLPKSYPSEVAWTEPHIKKLIKLCNRIKIKS